MDVSLGSAPCVNSLTTGLTPSLPSKTGCVCLQSELRVPGKVETNSESFTRHQVQVQEEAEPLNKPWLPAQGRVLGTGRPSPVLLAPMQCSGHTGAKNLLLFILNSNFAGHPVSYPLLIVRRHLPARSRDESGHRMCILSPCGEGPQKLAAARG